jgi:Sulfatase-modifying factor enzyme 1
VGLRDHLRPTCRRRMVDRSTDSARRKRVRPVRTASIERKSRTRSTRISLRRTRASDPAVVCAWNTSFQPESSGSDCLNVWLIFDLVNAPANPVACVDWCDAFAYCRSIGKRLCGAFGGGVHVASAEPT